jgi:hypothetical protein
VTSGEGLHVAGFMCGAPSRQGEYFGRSAQMVAPRSMMACAIAGACRACSAQRVPVIPPGLGQGVETRWSRAITRSHCRRGWSPAGRRRLPPPPRCRTDAGELASLPGLRKCPPCSTPPPRHFSERAAQ